MEPPPWIDDLADDLNSVSFTSTGTAHRSTSSGSSSSATLTAAPSTHTSFSTTKSASKQPLTFSDLRFSLRLGSGDIGSVYLAELKRSKSSADGDSAAEIAIFAAKVMDKKELVSRNKEGRARTEKEILEMLDHPFLPALYAGIESPRWICLLTEFCPGGDLHILRQRQPLKRFDESAVRFYASEVVVALEYLHMLGIVYRDLKPENVLVRCDGHIMLTDFDLSLKCDASASTPQVILSTTTGQNPLPSSGATAADQTKSSCILPSCIVPSVSCFNPNFKRKKSKHSSSSNNRRHSNAPEFVAEPVDVRSMSFVGTHEYLAPEIVSGEGHGGAVDWWTLGIFMYEMFYGVTPFKGIDHELTLANIVARALEFPPKDGAGAVPAAAKDLMSQLLVKDPARRMGSTMGASAIKHHEFFKGVNWALLRCTKPPYVPPPFSRDAVVSSDGSCPQTPVEYY
ncbi:Serine/threonine-protein kinase D6PKL2 [Linum grandiflorum]